MPDDFVVLPLMRRVLQRRPSQPCPRIALSYLAERLRSGLQPLTIDGILSPNVVTTRRSTLVIGKPLFRDGDLSNYLRAQDSAVESHVRTTVTKSDLSRK